MNYCTIFLRKRIFFNFWNIENIERNTKFFNFSVKFSSSFVKIYKENEKKADFFYFFEIRKMLKNSFFSPGKVAITLNFTRPIWKKSLIHWNESFIETRWYCFRNILSIEFDRTKPLYLYVLFSIFFFYKSWQIFISIAFEKGANMWIGISVKNYFHLFVIDLIKLYVVLLLLFCNTHNIYIIIIIWYKLNINTSFFIFQLITVSEESSLLTHWLTHSFFWL